MREKYANIRKIGIFVMCKVQLLNAFHKKQAQILGIIHAHK